MPLPLIPIGIAALLPVIFAALRIFLLANIVGFIMRAIAAFGISYFVMQPFTDTLLDYLAGNFDGMPDVVIEWIGFFNFDKYLNLILSAQSVVWTANFILKKQGN